MKLALFILIILFTLIISTKDKIYDKKTILLGASLPKNGIMKEFGLSVDIGANAYFKHANETNIIKNKIIKFITYDDKYEPELTLKNINTLIEKDDVFALFGFVGTPTVKKILPIVHKNDIAFLTPFSGASFLREHKYENIINFRSSYAEEIEKIVSYLHDVKGLKKFAVFYQNDNYGEEGYISLIQALDKRGLELTAEGTYKRNTLSIRHAYAEMKNTKPEAIIMVGAYNANTLFINKAQKDKNFKDTIFCNISFGTSNTMLRKITNTKNLLFSQVVPNYMDSSIPVVKEYQTLMTKYYPNTEYDFISLESFLSAKIIVNALKNIQGVITQEKFLKQMIDTKKNKLDGLKLNYKNSQLLNMIYLFEYKDKTFHTIEGNSK